MMLTILQKTWQGRQFDNITFEDELDFSLSVVESIFETNSRDKLLEDYKLC